MSTNQQEALASLKVLAYMAKADGELQQEEQIAFADAFKQLQPPPEGITVESLLAVDEPIDQVLEQITSPIAQVAVYEAAYTMAKIGGTTPDEQQLLDKIRATFNLEETQLQESIPAEQLQEIPQPDQVEAVVDTLQQTSVEQLQEVSQPDKVEPVTDKAKPTKEIQSLILDYSIVAAILGLNPFPGLNLITTLVAYVLTLKMMRDIGAWWGYPKGQDTRAIVRNIFGGIGAFAAAYTAWATVSTIKLFVPFVGSVANASFLFTLTWAMGQATNQFYASGRQMDAAALQKVFREAKKEGETAYRANESAIAAKQKATEPQIKALSQDLAAGKITQKEYQTKIQEILSASTVHEIQLFSSSGTGVVEETITPEKPGRVRYRATYWPARLHNKDEQVTLHPKDPVYVLGRQGLTLLVVPVKEGSKEVKS